MAVAESFNFEVVGGAAKVVSALPAGITPFNGVLLLFVAVFTVRAFVQPRPFIQTPAGAQQSTQIKHPVRRFLGGRGRRGIKALHTTVRVLTGAPVPTETQAPQPMPSATVPESQKMLQGAFTALLDEVYIFDPDTHAVSVMNSKAEKRVASLGLKKSKMLFSDLLPEANRKVIVEAARNLRHSSLDSILFELTSADVPMELTLKLIHEDGGDEHLMAILRDVSLRVSEARAQADYVATLSHEMRTPLTSIKGAVDLIASGKLGDLTSGAASTLGVAQRNVDRLLRLTNDILDLEKMDAGEMRCDFEPVHLTDLINEAMQEISGYARQFDVTVLSENFVSEATVLADRVRLLQVMANLLSNAIKYSDPRSEVHIRIEEAEDELRVLVVDKGPGIPESQQPGLFEPYRQGPQVQRKVASTGLGLSIAKKIVEAHSGSIGFESAPGLGSTFYFEIPKHDSAAEVAA